MKVRVLGREEPGPDRVRRIEVTVVRPMAGDAAVLLSLDAAEKLVTELTAAIATVRSA